MKLLDKYKSLGYSFIMTYTNKVNTLAKSDKEVERLAAAGASLGIIVIGIATLALIGYFLITQTLTTLLFFAGIAALWMVWSSIYVSIRG